MATMNPNKNQTTDTAKSFFSNMADAFADATKAGFEMNQRAVDTWTKAVKPEGATKAWMGIEQPMQRLAAWNNGTAEIACRWATEMNNLFVDQMKTGARSFERFAAATAGFKANEPARTTEEFRTIAHETIGAATKNTERLVRVNAAQAEAFTDLVDETMAVRNGA